WVPFRPGEAAVIATTQAGGSPTGVRTFNGQWIGVYVSGYMPGIEGWVSPAPEGPWESIGTVHRFTTGPDYSLKYVPRFHPQMDGVDGVVVGYSESGQNGNDVYGATFVRGPHGASVPVFDTGDAWFNRRQM